MNSIQRAIERQAKLEAEATAGPWTAGNGAVWDETCNGEGNSPECICEFVSSDHAAIIAHLRNQAKLARDVIEAAETFLGDFLSKNARDGLQRVLQGWADHVNGEGEK